MSLGRTFADAGEWEAAEAEFVKVAGALPQEAEPAYNLAICKGRLGDSAGMEKWMAEARRRPIVSDRLRSAARSSGLNYW